MTELTCFYPAGEGEHLECICGGEMDQPWLDYLQTQFSDERLVCLCAECRARVIEAMR